MLRPLALMLILTVPAAGSAADYSDPTWPCIQRKVENLSLGLMWPSPVEPAADLSPDLRDLSEALSLRRVDVEDLQPRIEDVAAQHEGDPDVLGQVFTRVFDSLNSRRARIIDGIADFSLGQIALAEKIDAARAQMDAELAREEPDYDKLDTLEEQIDWDQTIYTDRQHSIQYLCETPVIIERRLFGIAQLLQQVAQDNG